VEEPVVVLSAHHLGTEADANGAAGAMVVSLVFHFLRPHSLLITGGLRTSEVVFYFEV
jgi:hypothetical protein